MSKKILVLVSERMGDAIFCTPAIAFLKAAWSECFISILALGKASAMVYANNPAVEKIFTAPSPATFESLKHEYDVLIDLHNSLKSLAYLPYWRKEAHISPRNGEEHQSAVALKFIQSLTGGWLENFDSSYRLYPTAQDQYAVETWLKQQGVDLSQSPILIGFHMGCYQTASRLKQFWRKSQVSPKDWPPAYFAQLQKMIYEAYPAAKIILTGVPSEARLAKHLHQNIPNVINAIGKTSVGEMAALMTHLNVFVTGDTGPLHVAVSTEVPIVGLFSVTDPAITGPRPLKPQHHLLREKHSSDISPEKVFATIQAILGKSESLPQ